MVEPPCERLRPVSSGTTISVMSQLLICPPGIVLPPLHGCVWKWLFSDNMSSLLWWIPLHHAVGREEVQMSDTGIWQLTIEVWTVMFTLCTHLQAGLSNQSVCVCVSQSSTFFCSYSQSMTHCRVGVKVQWWIIISCFLILIVCFHLGLDDVHVWPHY